MWAIILSSLKGGHARDYIGIYGVSGLVDSLEGIIWGYIGFRV